MINAARGAARGQFPRTGGLIRIAIRVRPGSPSTVVGGAYGDALVVRVSAHPVDGAATEAALKAVAKAFGVPNAAVTLVTGATSRDKVVDVAGEPDALAATAASLRATPP